MARGSKACVRGSLRRRHGPNRLEKLLSQLSEHVRRRLDLGQCADPCRKYPQMICPKYSKISQICPNQSKLNFRTLPDCYPHLVQVGALRQRAAAIEPLVRRVAPVPPADAQPVAMVSPEPPGRGVKIEGHPALLQQLALLVDFLAVPLLVPGVGKRAQSPARV